MIIAKWKFDGMFKADPNLVAAEIYSIGESATAQQILEKGKDSSTELHKCFEWDDSVAAERYRLEQAKDIVRFLVIDNSSEKVNKAPVRVFYNVEPSKGYVPTEIIFRNPDEHQKLLAKAFDEFRAFRNKYDALKEFQEIFDLFDQIA